MKVHNFKTREVNGRKRVSADVVWETAKRREEEIFYEVDQEFSSDISCNPDAFFLATLFPALYYGEKRYVIQREICPALLMGAKDALECLKLWYYQGNGSNQINLEVPVRAEIKKNKTPRNSACFFTGGIDSYATLFDNWNTYPKEHPGCIDDGIIVYGLDQDDPEKFEYVLSFLKKVESKLDITLIPVYTNIYLKYRQEDKAKGFYYWRYEYQGAALASIAHILSNRIERISIAATFDLRNFGPYGSHPLLDPNYSSNNLNVRHDGLIYSRLEKAEILVQNYPPPIDLRVCNRYTRFEPGNLNCGRCEKCIRTMLEFLVLGKLRDSDVFPVDDIDKDMVIKYAIIKNDYLAFCYKELIEPLKEMNRNELADAVKLALKRYHKKDGKFLTVLKGINDAIMEENDNIFLSSLKKIDKYIFKGFFRKKFLAISNKYAIKK